MWMGFKNQSTLGYGVNGTTAALPMWDKYFNEIKRQYSVSSYNVPNNIVKVKIDRRTGYLYNINGNSKNAVDETFRKQYVPTKSLLKNNRTPYFILGTERVNGYIVRFYVAYNVSGGVLGITVRNSVGKQLFLSNIFL